MRKKPAPLPIVRKPPGDVRVSPTRTAERQRSVLPPFSVTDGSAVAPCSSVEYLVEESQSRLSCSDTQRLLNVYHSRHDALSSFWALFEIMCNEVGLCISPPMLEDTLRRCGVLPTLRMSDDPTSATDRHPADTVIQRPLTEQLFLAVVDDLMHSDLHAAAFLEGDRSLFDLALSMERSTILHADDTMHKFSSPSHRVPLIAELPGVATSSASSPRHTAGSTLLLQVLPSIRSHILPHVLLTPQKSVVSKKAVPLSEDEGEGYDAGESQSPSSTLQTSTLTTDTSIDEDAVWRHLRGGHASKMGGSRYLEQFDDISQGMHQVHKTAQAVSGFGQHVVNQMSPEMRRLFVLQQQRAEGGDSSEVTSQNTANATGPSMSFMEAGTQVTRLNSVHRTVRRSFAHALDYSKLPPNMSLNRSPSRTVETLVAHGAVSPPQSLLVKSRSAMFPPPHAMQHESRLGADSPFSDSNPGSPIATGAEFPDAVDVAPALPPCPTETADYVMSKLQEAMKQESCAALEDAATSAPLTPQMSASAAALQEALRRRSSVLEMFEQRRRTTRLSSLAPEHQTSRRESVVTFFGLRSEVSFAPEAACDPDIEAATSPPLLTFPPRPQTSTDSTRSMQSVSFSQEGKTPPMNSSRSALPSSRETLKRCVLTAEEKRRLTCKRLTTEALVREVLNLDGSVLKYIQPSAVKPLLKMRHAQRVAPHPMADSPLLLSEAPPFASCDAALVAQSDARGVPSTPEYTALTPLPHTSLRPSTSQSTKNRWLQGGTRL